MDNSNKKKPIIKKVTKKSSNSNLFLKISADDNVDEEILKSSGAVNQTIKISSGSAFNTSIKKSSSNLNVISSSSSLTKTSANADPVYGNVYEKRVNIPRLESPNCTQHTDNSFESIDVFIKKVFESKLYQNTHHNKYQALFHELGLRLLYNSENDNYYSDLSRQKNTYQTDFSSNKIIHYAYELFSNIRHNHRYLKNIIKQGECFKLNAEIKFNEKFTVKEELYSANRGYGFLSTLRHEVIYSNTKTDDYANYGAINDAIDELIKQITKKTLIESFKKILKGEEIAYNNLNNNQLELVYTIFYQLFVVEAQRDPANLIALPLALEVYLSSEGADLLGENGLIPVCFKDAMQALSYMGDVALKNLVSIQYSNFYDGTNDKIQQSRQNNFKKICNRTKSLINEFKVLRPEVSGKLVKLTKNLVEICKDWYGFAPNIDGEYHQIQFFDDLGLKAGEVAYDGNCFFHSLAGLLNMDHAELRKKAADLMQNDLVAEDGRWIDLDFAEIAENLAKTLGVNILLIQQNTSPEMIQELIEHNFYYCGNSSAQTLYIGNIDNRHFVPLNIVNEDIFSPLRDAVVQRLNQLPYDLGDLWAELIVAANNSNNQEEDNNGDKSNSTVNFIHQIIYDHNISKILNPVILYNKNSNLNSPIFEISKFDFSTDPNKYEEIALDSLFVVNDKEFYEPTQFLGILILLMSGLTESKYD